MCVSWSLGLHYDLGISICGIVKKDSYAAQDFAIHYLIAVRVKLNF